MEKFKAACKQYSGVDIDINKSFIESGVDSLDVVELIMAVEEAYRITILDEQAEHLKSYLDLFNLIQEPKKGFFVGQILRSRENGESYRITAADGRGYELTRTIVISNGECVNWSDGE